MLKKIKVLTIEEFIDKFASESVSLVNVALAGILIKQMHLTEEQVQNAINEVKFIWKEKAKERGEE